MHYPEVPGDLFFLAELAANRRSLVKFTFATDFCTFLAAFLVAGNLTTFAADRFTGHVCLFEFTAERCTLVKTTRFAGGAGLGTTGFGFLVLSAVATEINRGQFLARIHGSFTRVGIV